MAIDSVVAKGMKQFHEYEKEHDVLWSVITGNNDSIRIYADHQKYGIWWTNNPDQGRCFRAKAWAEDIIRKLKFNNPRVIRTSDLYEIYRNRLSGTKSNKKKQGRHITPIVNKRIYDKKRKSVKKIYRNPVFETVKSNNQERILKKKGYHGYTWIGRPSSVCQEKAPVERERNKGDKDAWKRYARLS